MPDILKQIATITVDDIFTPPDTGSWVAVGFSMIEGRSMKSRIVVAGGRPGAAERSDHCREQYYLYNRAARTLAQMRQHGSSDAKIHLALAAYEKARDKYMIAADGFQLAAYGASAEPLSEATDHDRRGHIAAAEAYRAAVAAEELYPSGNQPLIVSPAFEPTHNIERYRPPTLAGDVALGAHWNGDVQVNFQDRIWLFTGRDGVELITGHRCWEYSLFMDAVNHRLLVSEGGIAWVGSLPDGDLQDY